MLPFKVSSLKNIFPFLYSTKKLSIAKRHSKVRLALKLKLNKGKISA